MAEERQVPFEKISDHYDVLEEQMLQKFFDFVNVRQHFHWIHWNMRDVNYGFAAIEHRFRTLNGEPILIPEDKKFDLARALKAIYGRRYTSHSRQKSIADKNKITTLDFLSGAEEATMFQDKQFVRLHRSTLRKVGMIAEIFERTQSKTLKTDTSWFQQHGFTPMVLAECLKTHWLVSLLIAGVVY